MKGGGRGEISKNPILRGAQTEHIKWSHGHTGDDPADRTQSNYCHSMQARGCAEELELPEESGSVPLTEKASGRPDVMPRSRNQKRVLPCCCKFWTEE